MAKTKNKIHFIKASVPDGTVHVDVQCEAHDQKHFMLLMITMFNAFATQGLPKEFFIDMINEAYDMEEDKDYKVKDLNNNESK